MWLLLCYRGPTHRGGKSPYDWLLVKIWLNINVHTEAHLFSVPNDCLWYDKLWGPSQRVVTLFSKSWVNSIQACKLSRVLPNNCVLLPFPHRVRHWTFVIDCTHFKNHKTCFSGYNMDEFPQLKSVNSQQAEQINRSLRSLATVLAHLRWETYLKVLELYFVHRILRVKKI